MAGCQSMHVAIPIPAHDGAGSEPGANADEVADIAGSRSRTRTYDPAVNSRLLYRLSYPGSADGPYSEAPLRTQTRGLAPPPDPL
jgi:hypothetical protein